MVGFNQSIGGKMLGEIGGMMKDVGKGVADVPGKVVEGTAQQTLGQQDAAEGKQLEQGQQVQTAPGQKPAQQFGWKASLSGQLGLKSAQTQQRLAAVRGGLRNIEQEMSQIRQQNQQQEQQKKQMEAQQQVQKKNVETQEKQKKGGFWHKMAQLGQGERRGAKGK